MKTIRHNDTTTRTTHTAPCKTDYDRATPHNGNTEAPEQSKPVSVTTILILISPVLLLLAFPIIHAIVK